MQFYTREQRTSMLFWSFAAQSMQAFLSINYPHFDRSDVLDPGFLDSRSSWCAPPLACPSADSPRVCTAPGGVVSGKVQHCENPNNSSAVKAYYT